VTAPRVALPDTAVKTAAELAAGASKWLELPPEIKGVFGTLPVGTWSMALWGPPGSFKSTSALVLGGALCQHLGRVVYLSLEEGHGAAVGERLRRLEIRRQDLLIACMPDLLQVVELAREREAKTIIIDSLGYLPHVDAEDLARLSREANVSYVVILHATKAGQARGPLSILHHVDVVIALEGGNFTHTKNRFGNLTKGKLPWT
jgi:predicted ATP-dependent serine protease